MTPSSNSVTYETAFTNATLDETSPSHIDSYVVYEDISSDYHKETNADVYKDIEVATGRFPRKLKKKPKPKKPKTKKYHKKHFKPWEI